MSHWQLKTANVQRGSYAGKMSSLCYCTVELMLQYCLTVNSLLHKSMILHLTLQITTERQTECLH